MIKCCECKIDDHVYWERLGNAMADDRVIRALYDFLKARTIKAMYFGKDIPVGEFQKDLKEHNRSETEHFAKWVVLEQDARHARVEFSDTHVASLYAQYKGGGEKAEQNKRGILRKLQLASIPGISKPSQRRVFQDDGDNTVVTKWIRYYNWDLVSLRQRYAIGDHVPTTGVPRVEVVDCRADIAAWEVTHERAGDRACDNDSTSDDGDEFDPDCPPSPSASPQEYEAWHACNAELYPGPDHCQLKGVSWHDERNCPYCSGPPHKKHRRA